MKSTTSLRLRLLFLLFLWLIAKPYSFAINHRPKLVLHLRCIGKQKLIKNYSLSSSQKQGLSHYVYTSKIPVYNKYNFIYKDGEGCSIKVLLSSIETPVDSEVLLLCALKMELLLKPSIFPATE